MRVAVHPDAWRDALRLGLQTGVAGAGAFLAAGLLGLSDPFLAIMMAATLLQRSVGGTLGEASGRLQSALGGSALGLLGLLLAPEGWGRAGALLVALAVVGVAASLRPALALGVLPVVGMVLGDRGDRLNTAIETSGGIAVGAGVGVLVSLLVWPDRAEARFGRHFRGALRATALRLEDAAAEVAGRGRGGTEHLDAWNEAVWLAAEAAGTARRSRREGMERRLGALRRLHDAVVILDRAAEARPPPARRLAAEAEALGREAARVLNAMAEGRGSGGRGRGIGAVDEALARVEAALRRDAGPPGEHHERDAVAFGLHEVRRTLAELERAG